MIESLLIAASLAAAPPSLELPIPEQYQGENTVIVKFLPFAKIKEFCGEAEPPKVRLGCAAVGQPFMWVINPCTIADSKIPGTYAHYLCHELAHTNGWVHD